MRTVFIPSIVTVMAAFILSPSLHAQSAPARTAGARSAASAPDLSGVWNRISSQGSNSDTFTYDEPSMTPWAEKRYKLVRQGVNGFDQGREDLDQLLWPYCMVPGLPRAYLRPGPIEIAQTPKAVYIIFEGNKVARQIYLDGRKHPDGAPATFMGHSTGRWDGETLIAETVNINKLTWLDGVGHPHTEALRIEERLRRLAQNKMEINFLFEDPGAYTKSWGGKKEFELKPDWELMEYGICHDPSQEEVSKLWEKALGEPY
jgi:hypothetical protein